eukprot:33673-Rhodomonas_salina.1
MIAGGYWFFVAQPSTVSVTGSVQCRGNEALVGGCLWVSDRAAADVGGAAVLEHNSARTGGGASVDFDASLAVSGHAAWRANAAREGGGIVVSGQGVGVNVSGAATFERNRAEVAPALLPCRPLPALIPPAILRHARGWGVCRVRRGAARGRAREVPQQLRRRGRRCGVWAVHRLGAHVSAPGLRDLTPRQPRAIRTGVGRADRRSVRGWRAGRP